MPALAIDQTALRSRRQDLARLHNQDQDDAWTRSLIDKVVELQSPRSKSRWSSAPSEDTGAPPRSPIGIVAKIRQAEERIEWLVTQIDECQLHLLEIPGERESEKARLDAEVQAVAESCASVLGRELVDIKRIKELDLHELRAVEMPLCDELYETCDRIRKAVSELQKIRDSLEQSPPRERLPSGRVPNDGRARVNTEVWVSPKECSPQWTPQSTPSRKKLTTLQRPAGLSDERWELMQRRQEAETLAWELEVVQKTLAIAREELAKELKEASEDAKHRILMVNQEKHHTVMGALNEKQKCVREKTEEIERTKIKIKAAAALEKDVNNALNSWQTAAAMVGSWMDLSIEVQVRFSAGKPSVFSKLLSEELGAVVNDSCVSSAVPTVTILGCKMYQLDQLQMLSASLSDHGYGHDHGLAFTIRSPLGIQQWQVVLKGDELVGMGGFTSDQTPRRFVRSHTPEAGLSPASAAKVRAETYRIVMNQA